MNDTNKIQQFKAGGEVEDCWPMKFWVCIQCQCHLGMDSIAVDDTLPCNEVRL